MFARLTLLLSCLVSATAVAQVSTRAAATPAPEVAETTPPPGGSPVSVASPPVDSGSVSDPGDQAWLTHHDLESDPLFVPATVLIGTGSAGLLTALFTGLGAHGIYKALDRDCRNSLCPNGSQHRIDSGKTLALVSTVLTGLGIAAVSAGVVMLIIAARRGEEVPPLGSARLRLAPGPTPLGIGAAASF
jgi:hypothetical protein